MSRPKVIDCFPFNNELDILECRLVELSDAVDAFVLVEATRDHQDHPKPLWFAEHADRFAPWADKIVHVIVDDGEMPSKADDADPWAREHAQREFIARGLATLELVDADVVLQSDVDEIPRALHARNVRPQGFWSFGQRGHFWAVDWLYPHPWYGTVASTVGHLGRLPEARRFAYMRDVRMTALCPPHLQDAGWHLSWLGGPEAALRKVGSFCHPEVEEDIRQGLERDRFYRHGIHVDGKKMRPVDVDETWPRWIVEGHAPASWYRPAMNNDCLDPTLDHDAEVADVLRRTVETVRPALAPTDDEWTALLTEIGAAHAEYCRTVSPANMAASIETCAWLLHLCRRLGARRVLDLGSGISSWLLRHHAATADHPVQVVSVDDYAAWLANTADFLAERFPVVDGLVTLAEFNAATHDSFDVVFHDIAGGDLRSGMMAGAAALVAPGGVIVFDDCHHDGHRHHAAAAAESSDMAFVSLHRRTIDKFSRFAMAGLRATVADLYAEACRTPSDICMHLPRMVELVRQLNAQHVIELGTRTGVSTTAWLHGLQATGGHLTSVDIDARPPIGTHDRWTFIQGDDTDPAVVSALEPADIVFIDTSHLYDHTVQELAIYRWLVRPGGVICLHDTELPIPEGAPLRPLYPVKKAVTEFVAETGWQWTNHPECWGFAVIRVPEEQP